jgi:hypothetical protein
MAASAVLILVYTLIALIGGISAFALVLGIKSCD